jgi:PAS domain S-box-containing protein
VTSNAAPLKGAPIPVPPGAPAPDALRRSEACYRRLFESAQDGILLLNADTGQIEDVNPFLIDMLGYSHAEFLGKKLWEVGPFKDIAQSKDMFERLTASGYARYEHLPLETKAGIPIAVEFVSSTYDCEGIKVIQCNIRNITSRVLAEKKLRASELRYEMLTASANDAIVTSDAAGRIFGWNPAAERLFGYAEAEVIGRPLTRIMPQQFQDLHRDGMARVGSGGERRAAGKTVELAGRRKDGSEFPLELSLANWTVEEGQFFTAIIRDITERKASQVRNGRQSQFIAALSQYNKAIAHCTSADELFPQVCQLAVQVGGMKMAWIGMVNAASLTVRPVADFGDDTGYLREIDVSIAADTPFGCGPTGIAIRENRPYWCQDFLHDATTAPWREHGKRASWGASAALPLHRNGAVVGAFSLYCGELNAFDESARDLLQEMAAGVSFALDNFARESLRKQGERALGESLTLLQTIVDTIPMRVFWKDRDLRFLGCNPAFARDAGMHEPNDVIGKDDYQMGWAAQADRYRADDESVMESGVAKLSFDEPQATPEGRTIWLRTSKVPLRDSDNETIGLLGIYEDITERKLEQLALRTAAEQFRGLAEQVVVGIFIIQDGKYIFVNRYLATIAGLGSIDEMIGTDTLRWVTESDRTAVAEDLRRLLEGEAQSMAMQFGVRRTDGVIIAVEANAARVTHDGRPAVIGLIRDISARRESEKRNASYVEEVRAAFMGAVGVATSISEMRDPYTAGHERRVADLAVAIGAEMGLHQQQLDGLRVAGCLHDIGKIAIPTEILSMPRKLTANEYRLVQGHARAGYDVLKGVAFPWPVALVALQHHERIDGSGYPQGLKGEAILLEARIMAVADVVEAMSSHRPYRPGMGIEVALAEIVRGRGTAYDANATDACLRLFREGRYSLQT